MARSLSMRRYLTTTWVDSSTSEVPRSEAYCSSTSPFAPPTPQARSVRLPPSNCAEFIFDAVRVVRPLDGRLWAMNVQEVQFHNFAPENSRVQFCSARASFQQRTAAVAEAAATEVEAVDREARFPRKAIDAARKQRLLGAQIPVEFGGDGASISDVTDMCYALGRACSSAGMIFAMHQT